MMWRVVPAAGRVRTAPAASTRQRGAAVLLAMLTVALVATLAATALWQQWRSVEIALRERERLQASWILVGALDWARLVLREDARSGGADHLAEPWSIALHDTRLTTFLAMDPGETTLDDDVFLSGQIQDAQARLNIANLIVGNRVSEPDLQSFERLFDALGIDRSELDAMVGNLQRAVVGGTPQGDTQAVPILPRRVAQLRWLGLSAASLAKLAPYVSVLPTRSPLNLNTADALVIAARVPGLGLSAARNLVAARARAPFRTLADATRALPPDLGALDPAQVGVATRFFEVVGRLQLHDAEVIERALVQRNGISVTTVWREREVRDVRAPSDPGR
jgi:general secretion pathway protein K